MEGSKNIKAEINETEQKQQQKLTRKAVCSQKK